jgi:hypothetical protein
MYLLVCSARPESRNRRKKEARNSLSPAIPPQDSKDVPVGLLCQARGKEKEEEVGQELLIFCYSYPG